MKQALPLILIPFSSELFFAIFVFWFKPKNPHESHSPYVFRRLVARRDIYV
jgi:hypothetical protein